MKRGLICSQPTGLRGKIQRHAQRYYCQSCQRYFCRQPSRHRYTMPFIQVTVRMFVSSKASSREVAQTMGVDQSTVVRWTQELGNRSIDPPQANNQLRPRWRGIVGIDGKVLSV